MKKWLFLFALWCALPILANAQSGVRYGEAAPIISGQTPGGPLSSVPNASISWCNSPANAVPCTNKATTYTDITLTTSCPTSTQVVLIGSTSCVAKTDSYGNWGVWVAAGTYTYTVTLSSGATEGPYTVTLASGGGGGAGNPAGNPCQPQYNNNGAFAGIADWCFDGSHTLTIGPSGIITLQAGVALNGITNEMLPLTLTSSTTGSAAKWTLPRLLAGNSVDGSANVPFPNAFIVGGLSDAGLTGAQFLGNLATCVLKNTTGTAPNLSCAASADLPFPTGLTGQALTANNGSPPAFASPGVGGRKVLTSTGDIILGDSLTSTRDRGTTIRYTSASPETVTLPQAGSGCPSNCFSSNFVFSLFQTGAGQQTITPTTSTINDQSTLAMIQNSWCSVSSPDNSNYLARCATYAKTGTGLNSTFNADGSTTFALNTALPNGETATTQAGGSNDTKVATDAYVDAAK